MNEVILHITNGTVSNPAALKRALNVKDGRYKLTIKRAGKRSLQQNKFYWKVIVGMVHEGLRELGHEVSTEETHDWLKSKFNYKEIVNHQTGEVERIPLSTTELNKEDFGIFIEKVQQFSAEYLNVIIPNPGSQMLIEY